MPGPARTDQYRAGPAGPGPDAPAQPKVDNRLTAGEMVAGPDEPAALDKRAYDLGYADGLTGEAKNVASILQWPEVQGEPSAYVPLNQTYFKGFQAAIPKRVDELARLISSTRPRAVPATKYPFMKVEIREGRLIDRAERMDAMLKAQGKPLPTMDSIGLGEVDEDYLTIKEFREEVVKRTKVEHDACKDEYTRPGKIQKCIDKVDEKYGGPGFQDWDRKEAQRKYQELKAVADRIEDVKNAGPVKLVGKAVGRGVGYAIDGDAGAEKGDEIGGIIGGVGDAVAVGKAGSVAKKRTANYRTRRSRRRRTHRRRPRRPDKGLATPRRVRPPEAGRTDDKPVELVKIMTPKGIVELDKTQVALEQAKAQKWLAEQKAADAKKPENQQRSDSQLIKEAQGEVQHRQRLGALRPTQRSVTVKTQSGEVKYTVEEYRKQVQKAEEWVNRQKMDTQGGQQRKSDEALQKEAAAPVQARLRLALHQERELLFRSPRDCSAPQG